MYAILFRNIIMFRKTFGGLIMKNGYMNIVTSTSLESRDLAIDIIHLEHFVPEKFTIRFDMLKNLPSLDTIKDNEYPLIINGTYWGSPLELRVFNVKAGGGGVESRDMLAILQAAGFPVIEKAILTPVWSHNFQILIEGNKFCMKDIWNSSF